MYVCCFSKLIAIDEIPINKRSDNLLPFESSYSLGCNLGVLPRKIAEEEIRQIPFLDLKYQLQLLYNFSLHSKFLANYLANEIGIGLKYKFGIGNFSFLLGDYHNFWFGFAKLEGFNNTSFGWINQPNFSINFLSSGILFKLELDAYYYLYESNYIGDIEISSKKNLLSGSSAALSLEQKFWSSNIINFGLRINYNNYNYKYWVAFYKTQEWIIFPEVFFGFIW